MAEVDLDGVIRSIAKKQHKIVMDAARKRHGRLMGMAAKAKDKAKKARYKHLAKNTLLLAGAAARRLQITAENAADSYARAIKKATEEQPAKPAKRTSQGCRTRFMGDPVRYGGKRIASGIEGRSSTGRRTDEMAIASPVSLRS